MSKTERQLKAIMFSDVKSFSAMMSRDEARTVRLVREHREIVRSILAKHRGEEHGTAGDSFFVLFASAVEAVQCAVEIQTAFHKRNEDQPPEEQIWIRIGIHLGDILVDQDEHRVYGEGINIAARTEPLADPGGICITRDVFQQVQGRIGVQAMSIGRMEMKNIVNAPELYQLVVGQVVGAKAKTKSAAMSPPGSRPQRWLLPSALVALALLATAVLIFALRKSDDATPASLSDKKSAAPSDETSSETSDPPVETMTLTVLPFENVTHDEKTAWMSVGLARGIADSLLGLDGLRVTDPPSAPDMATLAKRQSGDALAVAAGRRVGARWVVAGNYTTLGAKVRVAARVLVVDTGDVLKVVSREGALDNILELQEHLTAELLTDLLRKIRLTERDLSFRAATTSDAAYQAMARYWSLHRREGGVTSANFDTLRGLLQEALRHDPEFAVALQLKASLYFFRGVSRNDPVALREALKWADAFTAAKPNEPFAHTQRSRILMFLGAYTPAAEAFESARKLDPDVYYEPGLFAALRQYDREEQLIHERIRRLGSMYWPHSDMANFQLKRGNLEKARDAIMEAVRIYDESHAAGEDCPVSSAGWVRPIGAHALHGTWLLLSGELESASSAFRRELAILDGRTHTYKAQIVATCYAFLGLIAERQGDKTLASEMNTKLAKALDDGGPAVRAVVARSMVHLAHGEFADDMLKLGLKLAREAVDATKRVQPFFLDTLAQAYEQLGHIDEALAANAEGQALLPESESFSLRAKRIAEARGATTAPEKQ